MKLAIILILFILLSACAPPPPQNGGPPPEDPTAVLLPNTQISPETVESSPVPVLPTETPIPPLLTAWMINSTGERTQYSIL